MTPPAAPVSDRELALLEDARRGVLATIAEDAIPRLVPVCFAVVDDGGLQVVTPLDEKRKRVTDVRRLARVRDILARPVATLLVDRWDEDWSRLAWLRLRGEARLVEPAPPPSLHASALAALRAKYPQYAGHDLETRPMIAILVTSATSWGIDTPS